MITYLQAIILGLIQGITELFPVSSLGHSVILPHLFGWHINQNDPFFLTFLVATHFATALVLFLFFWRDWVEIIKGFFRSLRRGRIGEDTYSRLAWLLIYATIPAGILGLLLQNKLRELFASPLAASIFLIVNGLMLWSAEYLRRRKSQPSSELHSDQRIAKMNFRQTVLIGVAQAAALIPGISRSGTSMTGGLLSGLSNEDAARFAFLLATPVIGAAALLKLPDLLHPQYHSLIGPAIFGALFAALGAYLSTKFLVRFFQTNRLIPFAVYCIAAGIIFAVIIH